MTSLPIGVQGIPIAYEVRGEGRPILLIHGWSADRGYMLADLEPILANTPGGSGSTSTSRATGRPQRPSGSRRKMRCSRSRATSSTSCCRRVRLRSPAAPMEGTSPWGSSGRSLSG